MSSKSSSQNSIQSAVNDEVKINFNRERSVSVDAYVNPFLVIVDWLAFFRRSSHLSSFIVMVKDGFSKSNSFSFLLNVHLVVQGRGQSSAKICMPSYLSYVHVYIITTFFLFL